MGELLDKAKGKIKELTGSLTGNKSLKAEGKMDETKGEAKGAWEDIKRGARDVKREDPTVRR